MKDEIDCPGCGDKIKLKPKHHTHEVELDLGAQTQVMQPPIVEEKPKKLTHEEIGEIMPKGLNFMSCPGGDCGHQKIKNPKPTKKFKTCPNGNCGANTVPKDSEFCPTCGKNIDDDADLDDGVELEDDKEDE